jgi:nicotinamidase-related amidase
MVTSFGKAEILDRAEIARRPLQVDECALVIIDIQERLLPHMFNREEVARNAQLLVRLANILGVPVLVTTQYAKGLGPTIPELCTLLPGARHIDKLEFNAFSDEAVSAAVKALPGNRNTLLLTGMEAHVCVLQSALGALNQGYLVHIASDCIASRVEWNWRMAQERMRMAGCVISSTEIIMYELLRRSGTSAFKDILKYVK